MFNIRHITRSIKNNILRKRLFVEHYNDFNALLSGCENRFELKWSDCYACYDDNTKNTGFDRHYIYHTSWAAIILKQINPDYHIDISSSLYFCSIISAFIPIRYYDYRPPNLQLSNLEISSADLTNLHFLDNSLHSISCMHVVEHIGLGRYGDPLDPDGDIKASYELSRVIAPGGSLLFVVPVGSSRICFNAHRIYSYQQVINMFPLFDIQQISLVADDLIGGGIIENASLQFVDNQKYGCGLFWFIKK